MEWSRKYTFLVSVTVASIPFAYIFSNFTILDGPGKQATMLRYSTSIAEHRPLIAFIVSATVVFNSAVVYLMCKRMLLRVYMHKNSGDFIGAKVAPKRFRYFHFTESDCKPKGGNYSRFFGNVFIFGKRYVVSKKYVLDYDSASRFATQLRDGG